ncbi:MAG: aldo/keto reductase [Alphaproteobacteria bacterium]|nr:aldo/keto reductase [Alphaproteobacteria bacterium]
MEYRYLGRTGLQLSVLSYGSWVTFSNQLNDALADRLMGISYEHGVNFFDNAEVYALGESENQMGRVLKMKNWDRTSYLVSSKVFFGWRGKNNKPNQTGLSRKHIIEACHEALKRLQLDYLDIFYCHRPDKNTAIIEILQTMNILIQQGKILYWGTSEWSGVEIMEALILAKTYNLIPPVVEQPEYNLFVRNKMENEYSEIFKNHSFGTTIWSPLNSGILTGKYNTKIPDNSRLSDPNNSWLKDAIFHETKLEKTRQYEAWANSKGFNLAALSIAWCLLNKHVTSVILGASNEQQLLTNFKALEEYSKITPEVCNDLETIFKSKPELPPF